jgi:hypothetical protein
MGRPSALVPLETPTPPPTIPIPRFSPTHHGPIGNQPSYHASLGYSHHTRVAGYPTHYFRPCLLERYGPCECAPLSRTKRTPSRNSTTVATIAIARGYPVELL